MNTTRFQEEKNRKLVEIIYIIVQCTNMGKKKPNSKFGCGRIFETEHLNNKVL